MPITRNPSHVPSHELSLCGPVFLSPPPPSAEQCLGTCSVVAASPDHRTSVTCALPLQELKQDGVVVPPFFAGEFFLRTPNEQRSWSGSPMYSTETGQLLVLS